MTVDIKSLAQQKREEAARALAEAERLETVADLLSDSEMRKLIEQQLGVQKHSNGRSNTAVKKAGGKTTSAGFEKLRSVMMGRENAPITIKDLADETGLTISSIRQWMTKTKRFEKVSTNLNREGLYRLLESVNEEADEE